MTEINKDCPCSCNCPRHGNCEACRAHHEANGSLTACQIAEKPR